MNPRPIEFETALRHDDSFIPRQPRTERSQRCLCSQCRKQYVTQKPGERALCLWCKYDPNKENNT